MNLSTQALGAAFGLLIGGMNFFGFRMIIAKLRAGDQSEQVEKRVLMLQGLAWLELIAFPIIGFFLAPLLRGL